MLIYHFNRAWKEYDRAQRLDTNILAVQTSLQRAQLQVRLFEINFKASTFRAA